MNPVITLVLFSTHELTLIFHKNFSICTHNCICSLKDMCSVGSHFIKSREEKRAI